MRSFDRSILPSLREALAAALAIGPGFAIGCGGSTDRSLEPGIERDPGFIAQNCGDGQPNWLADIEPTEPVDYMELRRVFSDQPISTIGIPCGGATDPTDCQTRLDSVSRESGFNFGYAVQLPTTSQLLFTRGDEVGAVLTEQALRAFLGDINTPGEALLLAAVNGYDIPCQGGGVIANEAEFLVQGFTYSGCDGETRYLLRVTAAGEVTVERRVILKEPDPNCVVGRRPMGLIASSACRGPSRVGRYLARAAELEMASVPAFVNLLAEFAYHRAPSQLLQATARAANDEIRHALVVARLARRFNGQPRWPKVLPTPIRDLEAIAVENAAEGCVRETLGAVAGAHQAHRAKHAAIRRAYRGIAKDEARHAELAWAIARWIEPRLRPAARRRIVQARDHAVHTLLAELESNVAAEVQQVAGVPGSSQSLAMATRLRQTLWSS